MRLKIKRARTALPVKSLPTRVCVCRGFECKGLQRCPRGSCDCAKAERRVQRAAALRKSLLLRFANRKLPPGVALSRQEETQGPGRFMWGKEGGTEVRGKNKHVIHVVWGKAAKHFFSTLPEPALSATSPKQRHVLLQVRVGRRAASSGRGV